MTSRIILFFVFQAIVWTLYFNWDYENQIGSVISQKIFQVSEIPASNRSASSEKAENYQLILRNDGFYTKINTDKTKISGIWDIDYNVPSIVLKSPSAEYIYRIIEMSDDRIQLRLIDSHELAGRDKENSNEIHKLFSSSPIF